jgi:SAM-dependent methyltransferase
VLEPSAPDVETRLLDEIALAGPEHLDPAYVACYDRKAKVDATAELDDLRSRGLGPASTLIDFGAGTGTFAVEAASACARVIAVDVSPPMLEAIEAKAADQGATNFECVAAGFLSYEHHGAPVELRLYQERASSPAGLLEGHRAQADGRRGRARRDPLPPRSRLLVRPLGGRVPDRRVARHGGGRSSRGWLDARGARGAPPRGPSPGCSSR